MLLEINGGESITEGGTYYIDKGNFIRVGNINGAYLNGTAVANLYSYYDYYPEGPFTIELIECTYSGSPSPVVPNIVEVEI